MALTEIRMRIERADYRVDPHAVASSIVARLLAARSGGGTGRP